MFNWSVFAWVILTICIYECFSFDVIPIQQSSPLTPEDAKLVPGNVLFDCSMQDKSQHSLLLPCNDKTIVDLLPSLSEPSNLLKPRGSGNVFHIILTARKKSVNFFKNHYQYKPPMLQLNSNVTLSDVYNDTVTEVWSFNDELPGPTIRATLGDILEIELHNTLPVATGLYINGVFSAKDPIDGGFVRPGATKKLRFPLRRSGVFMYYSAVDASHQVAMGLYGALIVSERPLSLTSHTMDVVSKDPVVIISDVLLNPLTWQIVQDWADPLNKATEKFNGRIGNTMLVNGASISGGLQLAVDVFSKHQRQQQLHVLNICSGTPLNITIPGLRFSVVSQWLGEDGLSEDYSNERRTNFIMPSGSTATLLLELHEENNGQSFQFVGIDATRRSERRKAIRSKEVSDALVNPLSLSRTDPVLLEIPIDGINDDAFHENAKIVERFLIPSNDGLIHRRGFEDSIDFPVQHIEGTSSDHVAHVSSCNSEKSYISCVSMGWGFKLNDLKKQDVTLIDASLLFEILCPNNVTNWNINVTLYGISNNHLVGTAYVPDGSKIFSTEESFNTKSALAFSTTTCLGNMTESPIQFKGVNLIQYIQNSTTEKEFQGLQNNYAQQSDIPVLTWVHAIFHYNVPPTENKQTLRVATRLGETIPPPTLRIIYKANKFQPKLSAHHNDYDTPIVNKIKAQRLEQVLHELHNEQELLRQELHARYHNLKAKQKAMRGASTKSLVERFGGPNYNHTDNTLNQTQGLLLSEDHINNNAKTKDIIEKVLNQYSNEQVNQIQVERKLDGLLNSGLPPDYQYQIASELKDQMRKQFLQQSLLQQQLRNLLQTLKTPTQEEHDYRNNALKTSQLSLVNSFKEDKALYLHLYKDYNDIVSQTRHLKTATEMLLKATEKSHHNNATVIDAASMQNNEQSTAKLVPVLSNNATTAEPSEHKKELNQYVNPTAQTYFNLKIRKSSGQPHQLNDNRLIHYKQQLRSWNRLLNDIQPHAGSNVSLTWSRFSDNDNFQKLRMPFISLVLGMSLEADVRGHTPMWIRSSITQRDAAKPGSLILWKIVNPTMKTHTLYFHRILLEVFYLDCFDTFNNVSSISRSIGMKNTNNGDLIGITIPSATQNHENVDQENETCIVYAISRVPKIYAEKKGRSTENVIRLPIRIKSSNREHSASGMHAQVHLNVIALPQEHLNILDKGANFMEDWYDDDYSKAEEHDYNMGVALGAGGCAILLGGYLLVTYYRKKCQKPFSKPFFLSHISHEYETTPLDSLNNSYRADNTDNIQPPGLTPGSDIRFDARNLALKTHTPLDTSTESYLQSPDKVIGNSLKQRGLMMSPGF